VNEVTDLSPNQPWLSSFRMDGTHGLLRSTQSLLSLPPTNHHPKKEKESLPLSYFVTSFYLSLDSNS
jgi:hypothetical protein